jgi:cell division protein FtsQ
MKTKINFKKILTVAGWVSFSASMLFLLGFVNQKQEELKCSDVVVEMKGDLGHEFVDKNDVLKLANSKGKLIGKSVGTINTSLLEKIILSNPFIEDVEVYSAIGGVLHIDLIQRNPIVRIINHNDEQYYIDQTGAFMPVSDRYTPPSLVANGYIFNTYSEMNVNIGAPKSDTSATKIPRTIVQVYVLAQFLEADSFWSTNTEQIYVNEFQELELIPRVGDHKILLGDTTNLSEKMDNLFAFYREGLNKLGWNKYSVINLKYKDQVVCTKK